jgi:hypothetical protein
VKNFGLGGKALHVLHPGKADSADDDDPSDMGTDVDAEGNTVYCEDAAAFQIHNKSAFFKLQESAVKAGMKPEIVHRLWAPDWDGMVVVLDQEADAEMQMPSRKQGAKPGETEALRYVVIKEILKHASKGSGPKAGAKGDAKADAKDSKAGKGGKADSGDDEVSKLAVKYLRKISEENDGKTLSVKTVLTALSKAMSADKATAQVVPVTTLVKEAKWLEANASKFDATYNDDDRELKFGDGE